MSEKATVKVTVEVPYSRIIDLIVEDMEVLDKGYVGDSFLDITSEDVALVHPEDGGILSIEPVALVTVSREIP